MNRVLIRYCKKCNERLNGTFCPACHSKKASQTLKPLEPRRVCGSLIRSEKTNCKNTPKLGSALCKLCSKVLRQINKYAKKRDAFLLRSKKQEIRKTIQVGKEATSLSKKWKEQYGKSFYTSPEWLQIRYEVIRKNGGRCEACGMGKEDGVKLHVDHIKPRSKHEELELDINNLQVLCEACNLGKLNLDETDWRILGCTIPTIPIVN